MRFAPQTIPASGAAAPSGTAGRTAISAVTVGDSYMVRAKKLNA
jgi:hypothetical protein